MSSALNLGHSLGLGGNQEPSSWTPLNFHGTCGESLFSDGSTGRFSASSMESEDASAVDMKEGRVILRMEVSSLEHSHLIGIGGEKVREMRAMCSCLIHYPDGNENGASPDSGRAYPHLHSNEVSIRGKLPNVITGYQQVRDSIPFNLNYTVAVRLMETDCIKIVSQAKEVFGIDVSLKTEMGYVKQVTVRGPQVARTLLGAHDVFSFFSRSSEELEVSQTLRIHPHSQSAMWNLCDGEQWLKSVSSITKATINFPSARGEDKQTVTIRGSISGVAAAWVILMSMLPVTVRVFIGQDTDFKRGSLERTISHDLQVNFLVPRRERRPEDRQYVELRSFEGNIGNICKAYKELMGPKVAVPKRVTSAADKLSQLGLLTSATLGAATPRFLRKVQPKASSRPNPTPVPVAPVPPHPLYPPPYSYMHPFAYPSPYYPPAMPLAWGPMADMAYASSYSQPDILDPNKTSLLWRKWNHMESKRRKDASARDGCLQCCSNCQGHRPKKSQIDVENVKDWLYNSSTWEPEEHDPFGGNFAMPTRNGNRFFDDSLTSDKFHSRSMNGEWI